MHKFHTARSWVWQPGDPAATISTDCALLLHTENTAYVYFNYKRRKLSNKQMIYVQPDASVTIAPTSTGQPTTVTGLYFHS